MDASRNLMRDMVNYAKHGLLNGRGAVTLADLPDLSTSPTTPKLPLASFDKLSGFHSCAGTAVLRMMQRFPQHQNLEFVLELTLPFMLVSTYVNVYATLHGWWKAGTLPNRTNTNILTIELLHELVQKHQGVNKGTGQRCVPWFNSSVCLAQITSLLSCMRTVVEEICASDMPIPFGVVTKRIKSGGPMGALGVQHGVAILAMVGVLRHGHYYLSHAEVCEGTEAYKRIHKHYKLAPQTINKTYQQVAEELGWHTAAVEQIGCEMGRDIDMTEGFNPDTYAKNVQL